MDGAVHNNVVFERIAKKLQKQGYERDWKQSRSKKLKITMEKQEGEERHANSRILGHRPASVSSLLDTGDSSSTLVESQESEETDGKICILRKNGILLHDYVCWLANGTQVQAQLTVDSAAHMHMPTHTYTRIQF